MARKKLQAANPVTDGILNTPANVGMAANNLMAQSNYALNALTRNSKQLDYMYRGSWIVGAAVDAKADDMTRSGIVLSGALDLGDDEKLQREIDVCDVWHQLADGIRWGRLYGGAICVILIDGQDMATPLDPATVGPRQFRGLLTMDRWQLLPAIGNLVMDLGPDYGRPMFYTPIADASMISGQSGLINKKIHYSRVIRFEGAVLPFYQRMAEQGWGMSIIERLADRLVAYDSATQGAAQLMFKAHLRTVYIKGLTQVIAAGGPGLAALERRMASIKSYQSSEGLTVLDSEDRLEHFNNTFAGLSDMLLQFGEQIAGAIDTPLVRLLGQSPGGLGSSGESEMRNYYDATARDQERKLRWPLTKLLQIISYSTLGRPLPEGFSFEFVNLWQTSHTEQADNAAKLTGAVVQAVSEGLVSASVGLAELRKSSATTGLWSTIADSDIEGADDTPPKITLPGASGEATS